MDLGIPEVSVICLAYNHSRYIRAALDGFLMQKTDFPIEVLIHDDASTDGTAEIIRQYEQKHPDVIRGVYQQVNQYSRGVKISKDILLPMAKGRYAAWCEGDDYWTDPLKLQKQYDYMQQHPDCSLCVHNARVFSEKKQKFQGSIVSCIGDRSIPAEEVIRRGGGFCATNSIFVPMKYLRELPAYFEISNLDYVLQMYLASCGRVHCLASHMSVHRTDVTNSWTDRMDGGGLSRKIAFKREQDTVREAFDRHTHYRFHDTIVHVGRRGEFRLLLLQGKLREAKSEPYRQFWKEEPLKTKAYLYLEKSLPSVMRCRRRVLTHLERFVLRLRKKSRKVDGHPQA